MEYPSGQFGSAVLIVSTAKILAIPSLLAFGGEGGECWRHSLDADWALYRSSQNTGVLSTPI